LKGLFFNWIGNHGRIRRVSTLTENFLLIEIEAESFRSAEFSPGQKIMIRVNKFLSRTYTPFFSNSAGGIVSILVFLHGSSPGTDWAKCAKAGDACQFLGPKDSLNLSNLQKPSLFFGDETSIALAASLRETPGRNQGIALLLESSSSSETQRVLESLQIENATVVQRTPGDAHLAQVEAHVCQTIQQTNPTHLIFTGKATSIRRLRIAAGKLGIKSSQFKIRPYWSPGKAGMD
jgi:ferric-chelate reductase (NADPH)